MENSFLKIDSLLEKDIRLYKQNDQTLYLYGIDEYCLGIWKNSILSEKEEDLMTSILPVGIKINGCIFIYNENVYEDFDSLIEAEIEKLMALNCVNMEKFFFLVLKDVLYLDDLEKISFEKQIIYNFSSKSSEENFEVLFEGFIPEIRRNYYFFNSNIRINFLNSDNQNSFKLCQDNKYSFFFPGSKLFIDDISSLDYSKSEHLNQFIMKLENKKEINFNNLHDLTFEVHQQNSDKSYSNLSNININIPSLSKSENPSSNLAICGILNKNNTCLSQFFKTLLSLITRDLELFTSTLENSKILMSKYIIFNEVFQNSPVIISEETNLNNNSTKVLKEKIEQYINSSTTAIYVRDNSYPYIAKPTRLTNVHATIKRDLTKYTKQFFVKGLYEYYHYGQDNFNDNGWGCAYRSLQTLVSWFILNGVSKNISVPSIPQIQEILVKIGDKQPKFIGSNEWIGAIDVSYVLGELLNIECQIMNVMSGDELISKGREIANHFMTNGTPIMIGGGVYAYTIIGVEYDRVKGECIFLILDPHYPGEDDIKTITGKGWCDWKKMSLFEKNNFYNLCLPLIPK